jgi:hypothetical protein
MGPAQARRRAERPEIKEPVAMPDEFGGATPIFRVANLAASIDYYVNALAFTLDWGGEGVFASVSRDRCRIFLSVGDQGNPGAWAWVGVADAGAVHDQLSARGARIRNPPTNFEWAYEMQVEDLDGNVIRIGSDSRKDVPFGPWRDMNGRLWQDDGRGGWECVEPA